MKLSVILSPMTDTEQPTPILQEAAAQTGAARRVALNAASPFVAQVVTKLLMLGYLIVQYRLAGGGPLDNYIFAGVVLLYASTVSEWGLGTLLTREAAKLPQGEGTQALGRLFAQTLALRLLISLALFLPVGLFISAYLYTNNLSLDGAYATLILTLSLLPGAFSGSVTALLYSRERMSLPAAIGVGTAALNVALGVAALFSGLGIVGLAWAATLSAFATAFIFAYILRRAFPELPVAPALPSLLAGRASLMGLLSSGWPLMLNALLVGLFFRADQFIIKANSGPDGLQLERYNAGYSFLGFVLLITPAVTLALFPRMSRHAATDRPRLRREYLFATRLLLILSVPIVALTVWFAPLLITVVTGGKEGYLPEAATALQILIFFLPFSFVNGVTQYVLIALDLQRLITKAFVVTVLFNLGANLLLVPALGINGAALATIGSELVLLGPFLLWTGREIGSVPLLSMFLKPLLAGLPVAVAGWLLWPAVQGWKGDWGQFAIYLAGGALLVTLYGLALFALRPISSAEWQTLRSALRRR